MGNIYALTSNPDEKPVIPPPNTQTTFPPELGFSGNRKPREMIATPEQLESAKIAIKDRDYCSHLLLEYRGCRTRVWPFAYKCHHEKHAYLTCEYEDYVLRMKEYEREKRLRQKEQQRKVVVHE